jgi:hypothetical protein
MEPVFKATILGRHEVQYFSCEACSFLQTEKPYWLEDAYCSAIGDCDTGIMERNLHNVLRVSAVLKLLKLENDPIMDMAGGYGILTRLLRDVGFDCRWSDKYCDNLIANGFQAAPGLKVAAVCAFEAVEHIENPLDFFRDAIKQYGARVIIFSTEDFEEIPSQDWWYYSRETGQHISFYSGQALKAIAKQLGWFYYPLPRHLHLYTACPIAILQSVIMRTYLLYPYGLWVMMRMRRHSRTQIDRERTERSKYSAG